MRHKITYVQKFYKFIVKYNVIHLSYFLHTNIAPKKLLSNLRKKMFPVKSFYLLCDHLFINLHNSWISDTETCTPASKRCLLWSTQTDGVS